MIIPYPLRDELLDRNNADDEWNVPSGLLSWRCQKDSRHVWEATLYNRMKSPGCPVCSNRKIIVGVNDFATTHSSIVSKAWSSKNTVDPKEITSSYSGKVWWVCSLGHEYETKMAYYLRGCACPYCNGNKVLKGFNDAATLFPDLLPQVSPKSTVALEDVSKGSTANILWLCSNGHEWEASVPSRVRGRGCPYCSNKKVLPGFNDLATTDPLLSAEWHPSLNDKHPHEITRGADYKAYWICPRNSKHIYEAVVYKRTQKKNPTGCPFCDGKRVIAGDNDFLSNYPLIAQEFSERNLYSANMLSSKSNTKVWWKDEHGHEWQASPKNRANGMGCPFCSNRKVLEGFNDLATRYPQLAEEWNYDKNHKLPSQVTFGGTHRYWWKCSKGHEWQALIGNRVRRNSGCPSCARHVSRMETEVADYIKSILPGVEVKQSDRSVISPKELDIYIPAKKVAIEFNGLYWHTEAAGKDRNYHHDKWQTCQDQGIQLIQVWEDEWRDHPNIVKSMLAHKLGVSSVERVYARKTVVCMITKQEARAFLEQYHIQGFASGTYYLGLRAQDGLVAVMVLRRLKDELYLDRYATSKHVVGGQGKLLAWTHENIEFRQLVTFADLHVSDGSLYEATGWVKNKVLKPDYRYLVDGNRVHKFNYRLKRFRDDPTLTYEEGLSESRLAQLNGLDRVWDTGKIRYVMARKV